MRMVTQAHTATENICKFEFTNLTAQVKDLTSIKTATYFDLPFGTEKKWHEVNDKGAVRNVPSYRVSGKYACACVVMSSLHREKRMKE